MPIINMVYKKKKGWQPGANTLLYLPLQSDAVDMSGNNRTTSPTSVTYTTVGGVHSANFTRTSYITVTPTDFITTSLNQKTISVWVYVGTLTRSYRRAIMEFNINGNCDFGIMLRENTDNVFAWAAGGGDALTATIPGINQWFHIAETCDSSGHQLYINGNLISSGNGSSTPRGNVYSTDYYIQNVGNTRSPTYSGGQGLEGNMRELILEDKVWTAQEVANYYNQTKANYGL